MTSDQKKLLICTHNRGKLSEIKAILAGMPVELLTLDDIPDLPDPVEDGETFLANAQIKARSAFDHTGLTTLADDSGLVVPLLNGAPGIFSARYGGCDSPERKEKDRANRQKLLQEIRAHGKTPCDAFFQCTMVLKLQDGHEIDFGGQCHGKIIDEERGEHGFGYDPLFFVSEFGVTFAQLPPEEKNKISHRALALRAFYEWIEHNPSRL